ncbi:unnamed protein product [marine sediment metagenome]|uniref:Uncharacterized protein n=1 Tax=marine sediment metagenome TaxID=412755 RepID=X1RAI0_9ZZZZ
MPSINVRGLLPAIERVEAEEVAALPPPSAEQVDRIVKLRTRGLAKVYICLRNSDDSYAWIQMAISE